MGMLHRGVLGLVNEAFPERLGQFTKVASDWEKERVVPEAVRRRYFRRVVDADWERLREKKGHHAMYVPSDKRLGQPREGDVLAGIFLESSGRYHMVSKPSRTDAESLATITPDTRAAFQVLDADNSGMLDSAELDAGFEAMGIDPGSKEAKRLLKKYDDGDKLFSLLEFSLLMADVREAQKESEIQRRQHVERAAALLRIAGTERGIRDDKSDEVVMLLRRGRGNPDIEVRLHKGLRPFPFARLLRNSSSLPPYVRTLTDPYIASCRYWEVVECFRKVLFVGTIMLFGQGSVWQFFVGMLSCAAFISLYNNIKPYDTHNNNLLQQLCQINIFVTLLAGVIIRLVSSEDPVQKAATEEMMRGALLLLTLFSSLIALPMTILEGVEEPREKIGSSLARRRVSAAVQDADGGGLRESVARMA